MRTFAVRRASHFFEERLTGFVHRLKHSVEIEEIDDDIFAAIRTGKPGFVLEPQDRLFMLIRAVRTEDYY